ncbi:MAG TPA: hypothetical protein VF042_05560 [Gemmatimonadaceae bacterium]
MARTTPLFYLGLVLIFFLQLPGLKQQHSNLIVEEGRDPSRLIIAFTGFHGGLNVPVFDFIGATGMTSASRILLRDQHQVLYLKGCRPEEPSFAKLLARLEREIRALGARHVTCVGTSGGGFAAILFGHLLGVDRVHAFAPTILGSVALSIRHGDWPNVLQRSAPRHLLLELTHPWLWKYLDLPTLMKEWNGRTEFTIHVCRERADDMTRVERLRGIPHVSIEAHPCSTHQVAKYLVRSGRLIDIFESS